VVWQRRSLDTGRTRTTYRRLNVSDGLFPVANNLVVDLRTGVARQRTKDDMFSKASPIAWNPNADTAPALDLFTKLRCGNVEEARFLQRLGGYCALTCGNPEQIVVIMHGDKDAAKSTFSDGCRAVAGPFGLVTKKGLLMKATGASASAEGPEPYLAMLDGIWLALASELKKEDHLSSDLIKFLTNDTYTVRTLHREPVEVQTTHKYVIDTNYPPIIDGSDDALEKRLIVIHCRAKFTKNPAEVNPENGVYLRVRRFLDAFKKEGKMPGLLKFLVEGAMAYYANIRTNQQDRFLIPESIRRGQEKYISSNDSVASFLSKKTQTAEGALIKAGELYDAYKAWFEDSGKGALLAKPVFGRELKKHGVRKARTGSQRFYAGIKLI
jgi:putative DNA primase/helicase